MIVWVVRFWVDKDKKAEYERSGKAKEGQNHILAAQGFREMRGYRNWVDDHVQIEYEFESYEAWAKYMQDPKTMELMEKTKSMVHGITTELLGPGLVTPEPIRPKR
jgi:hypothetical protein